MNKVILIGRLTKDPDVRYGGGPNATTYARYTLAVDRRFKREGEQSADFISCVAFGKGAEFTEKYFHQGSKVAVTGRIQTGSYTNKDGMKVYTTDVIVEEQEFAESKSAADSRTATAPASQASRPAPAQAQPYGAPQQQYPYPGAAAGYPGNTSGFSGSPSGDGFMNIPEGIDEELPFN